MIRYLIVLVSLLVSGKAMAQATCTGMQLQVNQTTFDIVSSYTFNPTIVVRANTQPGGCSFFLTFDYGGGSSYSNRGLRSGSNVWPFQLANDSAATRILKRFPDISSLNDVISGNLAAGSSDRQTSVNYWAILNMSNPWLPAGLYQDSFTVSLYRGSPFSSYQFVTSNSIRFTYNAGNRVDISLVPSGGSFDISDTTETLNFGTLTTGAVKSADAILKYNTGYILKASSANNGRLKHQTQNEYIDYTAKFNSVIKNLANTSGNPLEISRQTGQSPASGTRIPIDIVIGDVSNKPGGQYSDTITLTVTSTQ